MAYTFLKAQGYEIGISMLDETKIDYCKEMLAKAEKLGKKILLNTCYRSMCSVSRTESVTYIYISKVSKLFCECISGFLWLCLLFAYAEGN